MERMLQKLLQGLSLDAVARRMATQYAPLLCRLAERMGPEFCRLVNKKTNDLLREHLPGWPF